MYSYEWRNTFISKGPLPSRAYRFATRTDALQALVGSLASNALLALVGFFVLLYFASYLLGNLHKPSVLLAAVLVVAAFVALGRASGRAGLTKGRLLGWAKFESSWYASLTGVVC